MIKELKRKRKDMKQERTLIYLIRHGESEGNVKRICLGHTDLDLTERGYTQAKMTAEALSEIELDAIYASDLKRAYNTALPHALMRGMAVTPSESFRELYFGDWENTSIPELIEKYGDMFTVEWRQVFGTFTAPRGESVVHMAKRMEEGLKKAASENLGGNVLVASHAAAIRSLWGKISGVEPGGWAAYKPFPSNASYSVIEYCEGRLIPLEYSCDSHLGELATAIPADVSIDGKSTQK